ncbi:MAG: YdeI/OmpD-associated family protein [Heliomarina sp.]|uniref:YdeI/OmpD-associated family protein n=1 Tax=Heliomarina sp. TaxID=2917556 RepID=UPI00405943C0
MGTGDPRIERYLAKDRPWQDEMIALRGLLLSEDLEETLKWRSPCYRAHGANVLMMDCLKEAAFISFFKGVLLDDPEGRLEMPGPNSRSARYLKFTSVEEIGKAEEAIRGLVRLAIQNEKEGRKVALGSDDLDLPEELISALEEDPELAGAWDGLTPGRRRGWVVHVSGAKQAKTRLSRIEKARPQILAGKGMHDR